LLSFGREPATIEVAAKSTYTATFFIEKNAVRFRLVYGAEKYRGKDSKIHVHSPESSPASLIAIPVRYVPLESYHRRKNVKLGSESIQVRDEKELEESCFPINKHSLP
jgi:hypothetical protein